MLHDEVADQDFGSLDRVALADLYRRVLNVVASKAWPEFREIEYELSGVADIMLANSGAEKFVVHARDEFISKGLYTSGQFDFEKFELALDACGRKIACLVDIGANIGSICIPAVKRGLVKRAIAIEPEPTNFRLLMANIFLNDVADSIRSVNVALGAQDDTALELELCVGNRGDHRISVVSMPGRYDEAKRERISVKAETLDSVMDGVDLGATLVWMDTQGYEGHILCGAKHVCSQRVPMVIEFWPYGMRRAESFLSLKQSLEVYDSFYDLGATSLGPRPLTNESLDELYSSLGEEGAFTDILVI